MPVAPSCRGGLPLVVSVLLLVVCLVVAQPSRIETAAQQAGTGSALIPIDVRLRSDSTGTDDGSLAVRVHAPQPGNERYPEGAPVIIWILGGFEVKGINHGLPAEADDVICITRPLERAFLRRNLRLPRGSLCWRAARCGAVCCR